MTDHIWELEELLDALLSVSEMPAPLPKPLAYRKPEGTARELPNGRGFLRLVGDGNGPSAPPPAPAPPPAAPIALVQPSAPAIEVDARQLDLFSWKPRPAPPAPPKQLQPGQLSLFGIDFDPEN